MNSCRISDILKRTLRYRSELIRGNAAAITATVLTVAIPLFIPLLVDELLLKKSARLTGWVAEYLMPMSLSGYVLFFLIVVLILRMLGFFLNVYQVRTFLSVSKAIAYDIRKSAVEHLKRVSLKEYETASPDAISSRLVTDIATVDSFIGVTVSKFIISILTLLFTALVLLLIDWKLALFILLTNPVVVFFTARLSRNVGRLKREENRAVEEFQNSLGETLDLFHQIRAASKEDRFFSRVLEKALGLKRRSIEFGYKSDRAMRLSFLVFLGGYELFRSVSILAVAGGDLSIGLMLAVFGYLWIMMTPTQDVINFQYALASARAACRRIEGIFEMERESGPDKGENPFKGKESISINIENLKFSYLQDKIIFNNINMSIPAGSKVAIVGPSGSGKTTLANIIMGFYPQDEGDIFYDNIESRQIPLATIRSNIHLILQQPKLFNDTIRFNLTLGRQCSDELLAKAAEQAQLGEWVSGLEEGFDTQVGREGVKLSGGQRQRIAIARMLLEDPAAVIFDESTSALDTHTEMRLFNAMGKFLEKKTVITIAHRLSTIEKAELIYVLENGRIVDHGTPDELRKRDEGYFAQMI